MKEKDWQGHDVPANESPTDEIRVWEITPGNPLNPASWTNPDCDLILCRGYEKARAIVHATIDKLMEESDPEVLDEESIEVRIRLVRMTLADYLEIAGEDA